ncbi:L,D-transpeptidase family protein [Microvirga roseola]|uniref:L,D-transpeptidase family protein n=1 Tax=Microvirga roseola TaxID=2883126 RepID=UPI001E58E61B|nr:L,D-transpeptidase [Microvirga roseola]
MKALAYVLLGVWGLVSPALAASAGNDLSREAVNGAQLPVQDSDGVSPIFLKTQVLLDRARFSPGVIDGRNGDNTRFAIRAFEKAHDMEVDGRLDEAFWSKLTEGADEPVLVEYEITEDDVSGPFTEIPDEMEEQADLERLAYTNAKELLAEKFHMDQDLLERLNPNKDFTRAGETIVVANVDVGQGQTSDEPKVAKVEVLKGEKAVRALAEDGSLIAVYPATIGSDAKPAPDGSYEVKAIAMDPNYTYNPNEYRFEDVKTDEPFQIAPGPNNPVGTVWIDLSAETYGIHGTPEPAKIGKTYSHGCVRLTNWDAVELAKMVEQGTPVAFLE